MKPPGQLNPRTGLDRSSAPKRRKRLNPTRAPKAEPERYRDSRGVPFDSYHLLPPLNGLPVRDWPKATRVSDPTVCWVMHSLFDLRGCWNCRGPCGPLEAHHLAAGSRGRSDEFTVIVMVGRGCHAKVNTKDLPLGRLLFLKWYFDRAHLDYIRLAILLGRRLPDLVVDAEMLKADWER